MMDLLSDGDMYSVMSLIIILSVRLLPRAPLEPRDEHFSRTANTQSELCKLLP